MWDDRLADLVADYPTGVLIWVAADGDPPLAADALGLGCILFHQHDDRLEGLRQMVVKGELYTNDDALVLRVTGFVTANGRAGTDRMPHAGAPLHMLQFYRLGRRKAREYLARRGEPWPPIPFEEIGRAVADAPD